MLNEKRLTEVDGRLTAVEGSVNLPKPALTCDDAAKVDGVDAQNTNFAHAHTHMHAHAHTHGTRMKNSVNPSTASTSPSAVVRGGRAVVDGVEHVMRVAKPGVKTAKRYGLNANHHLRVWCECMAGQKAEPGTFPSGPYWNPARPPEAVASDPRRLGGWDWLGVVDMRGGPSALDLFKAHIREVANGHRGVS